MAALGEGPGLDTFPNPLPAALRTVLTQGATAMTSLQDFTLRRQMVGNLLSDGGMAAKIDL